MSGGIALSYAAIGMLKAFPQGATMIANFRPISALLLLPALQAQTPLPQLSADLEAATRRVKEIVNRPVPSFAIGPNDHPAEFKPGWFHEGSQTPDFLNVDVRASQVTAVYAKYPLVTSDVCPGLMYSGAQIEFNAMTKFFYTDRTQPKRRLDEAEMLEVNQLYRVIGTCLRQLREAQDAPKAAAEPAQVQAVQATVAALGLAPAVAAPLAEEAQPPAIPGWKSTRFLGSMAAALVLLVIWAGIRNRR